MVLRSASFYGLSVHVTCPGSVSPELDYSGNWERLAELFHIGIHWINNRVHPFICLSHRGYQYMYVMSY